MFADPRNVVPTAAQLEGKWKGRVTATPTATSGLFSQVSPVEFEVSFAGGAGQYRAGAVEFSRAVDAGADFRLIDDATVVGKCASPSGEWRFLLGRT
jgi:hypothetical protein